MENYEIAYLFQLTANLMSLHGGDEFKARAYSSAANNIEKAEASIRDLGKAKLEAIVSAKMADKVLALLANGTLNELEDLKNQTPEGVFQLLKIKGLGPKKVAKLWKESNIDTVEKLQEVAQNGQLVTFKGWGESSVADLLASLNSAEEYKGKLRMDDAETFSAEILKYLLSMTHFSQIVEVGAIALKSEVVEHLDYLVATDEVLDLANLFSKEPWLNISLEESNPFTLVGQSTEKDIKVFITQTKPATFTGKSIELSAKPKHLAQKGNSAIKLKHVLQNDFNTQEQYYEAAGLPFIIPEMREGLNEFGWAKTNSISELVTYEDLRGPIHNHSKYSDGLHSLTEIVAFCKQQGWEYLGIADHSQSGRFYNNGMTIEAVEKQWAEIDLINSKESNFTILKGVESDILANGELDYPSDVLAGFDYVVSSIHGGMKMDIVKATDRLITAINNPYTSILGHLTGRLLLKREGYPVDHKAIIDECARCGVAIEINAHPWRLDLDWRHLSYAAEQGVMISINPDAHEMPEFLLMKYGVFMARKAGLLKSQILNTKSTSEIKAYFANQRKQQTTPEIA